MRELYLPTGSGTIFARVKGLGKGRPVLLFFHGLGDSGLAFAPAFDHPLADHCGLIVPDLPGHGRSSEFSDYSLESQAKVIAAVLHRIGAETGPRHGPLYLVAHSMGSIPAEFLARDNPELVEGILLAEGSVTQYGSFISAKVAKVVEREAFDGWFDEFAEETRTGYVARYPFAAHYYASLRFCRRRAFRDSALDLHRITKADSGKWTNRAGNLFAELKLKKAYVMGERSPVSDSAREFLAEKSIPFHFIDTDSHFVVQADPARFYGLLADFVGVPV